MVRSMDIEARLMIINSKEVVEHHVTNVLSQSTIFPIFITQEIQISSEVGGVGSPWVWEGFVFVRFARILSANMNEQT